MKILSFLYEQVHSNNFGNKHTSRQQSNQIKAGTKKSIHLKSTHIDAIRKDLIWSIKVLITQCKAIAYYISVHVFMMFYTHLISDLLNSNKKFIGSISLLLQDACQDRNHANQIWILWSQQVYSGLCLPYQESFPQYEYFKRTWT